MPVSTPACNPIPHIPRTFSCDQYILPSDEIERKRYYIRLQFQHELIKRIYDNNLILAPVKFNSGDKILECGTGSGAWVMDISKSVPSSVGIHGFDIASRLFPLSPPSNLSFSTSSVSSMTKEWENSFKLVHQRLLMAGLQVEHWLKATCEMYRVVVPGGWVQLGEVGFWRAGPATKRHRELVRTVFESKGLLLDCADHLEEWVKLAGFKNIHVERRSIPLGGWGGRNGQEAMVNWIEVFRALKTPTLNGGGFGYVNSESEFDKMIDEVEREWDQTPGADMQFIIVYGQKETQTKN
ncbi:hypothetical protein BDQ17DRAFT_1391398 [Cyathus striatus]|nr:hypothetical protein BDQ17DRAFT_1391398 [Cyathus striatus]